MLVGEADAIATSPDVGSRLRKENEAIENGDICRGFNRSNKYVHRSPRFAPWAKTITRFSIAYRIGRIGSEVMKVVGNRVAII